MRATDIGVGPQCCRTGGDLAHRQYVSTWCRGPGLGIPHRGLGAQSLGRSRRIRRRRRQHRCERPAHPHLLARLWTRGKRELPSSRPTVCRGRAQVTDAAGVCPLPKLGAMGTDEAVRHGHRRNAVAEAAAAPTLLV